MNSYLLCSKYTQLRQQHLVMKAPPTWENTSKDFHSMAVSLILGYFYLFFLQYQGLDSGFCACQANSLPGTYSHNLSVTSFMSQRDRYFRVVCGLLECSLALTSFSPFLAQDLEIPIYNAATFEHVAYRKENGVVVQTLTCSKASGLEASKEMHLLWKLWSFSTIPFNFQPQGSLYAMVVDSEQVNSASTHSLHPSVINCSVGPLILGCQDESGHHLSLCVHRMLGQNAERTSGFFLASLPVILSKGQISPGWKENPLFLRRALMCLQAICCYMCHWWLSFKERKKSKQC